MLDKKYNSGEVEKKWQKYWEDNDIYKYRPDNPGEIYSIDTPPPTVSGSIHIGHIFSYTQAEIIARYQRMQGKNVFYPFGFDDNGLPTERLVEKEENLRAKDLPRSQFIEKCISTTEKFEDDFKALWKSMGFSVDWSLQYETINPMVQRISQKSFVELAKSGKAYMKESPVLWCTTCQTSIAQAELETKELESTFNYIPFIIDGEEVMVATTRPELLYGCTALFVNPIDQRYSCLIGKKALVPLYDYPIPVMGDERVSIEKGTGVVMCATFGDTTDLDWFNDYKLPYRRVIESDGRISKDVPYISGLKAKQARETIIEILIQKGLLKKNEKISHTVSTHERCGMEIEIIPSKQWYIDILSEKEKFLRAADEINWYPASMKIRYQTWVENLKWDWCISRQRYFGVPIPVWYCRNCGMLVFADESELPVNPLEKRPHEACTCGCNDFIPEDAVFDTWATSSLTPLINSKWREADDRTSDIFPMGLRTQAHEIIRTWAFYTIVKSLYHTGRIPWRDIMISGFVLAKKGEKISKSKNNSQSSPQALIERNSADSLRYWTAGARLGADTMFSEEDLKISSRFITKLWNAGKFVLMHLQDFDGKEPERILPQDRWIIESLNQTFQKSSKYLSEYEIGMARHDMDEFFWNDFCDNYLEIIKDRLYKPEIHGAAQRCSAQYGLYKGFLGILKLYSIYVPHITEEIYQAYFTNYEGGASIHNTLWDIPVGCDESILALGKALKEIAGEARKYKSDRNLSLKDEVKRLYIKAPVHLLPMLEDAKLDIKSCTSAIEISIYLGNEFEIIIED